LAITNSGSSIVSGIHI